MKKTTETTFKLRKPILSDAASIAMHANNEKIWEKLRDVFPFPYTVADAEFFIQSLEDTKDYISGIEVDGEIVGIVGILSKTDIHKLNGELGYWIGEKYWNKNIMTKAISDVMKVAFEEINLRRVYSEVFSGNEASCRVLEKNGFKLEAVIKENVYKNNKILDTYLLSKFNPKRDALPRTG